MSAGDVVVMGLNAALLLGGLFMLIFGAKLARQRAIKRGDVDEDGDPVFEAGKSPADQQYLPLIPIAIGAYGLVRSAISAGLL